MKVKMIKMIGFKEGDVNDVTVGKVYDLIGYDEDGDALIHDDNGDYNCLFIGEFEVVDESN